MLIIGVLRIHALVRQMPRISKGQRLKEHRDRNCLFCQLQKHLKDEESHRVLKVNHPEASFALLDKRPKVLGHTLVISRNPFNDFTDTLTDADEAEKVMMFEDAIELARKLQRVLKAEKVYIVSMCEDWKMWETGDGITTEHFHFHLIPRYPGMRNKRQAAEQLLVKDGMLQEKEALEKIARLLNESE